MIFTLHDRIQEYQDIYDAKIISKLPVCLKLNGRNFKKTTAALNKPFDIQLLELFCAVLVKLAAELDGFFFGYYFNDEIIIVLRNDQTIQTLSWCANKIQKISSTASSIASLEFQKMAEIGDIKLNNDPVFSCLTFAVPNIKEAINMLICKQQEAKQTAITQSCLHEISKKYDHEEVKKMLQERTWEEKREILKDYCNIDFNDYPLSFQRGAAAYRSIKLTTNEEFKSKIIINTELPIFTEQPDFLANIFSNGKDIFRLTGGNK